MSYITNVQPTPVKQRYHETQLCSKFCFWNYISVELDSFKKFGYVPLLKNKVFMS